MFQKIVDNLKSGIAVYTYVISSDDFYVKDFAVKEHNVSAFDYSKTEHLIGKSIYDVCSFAKNSVNDNVLRDVLTDGIPRDYFVSVADDKKCECVYKNFVYRLSPSEIVVTFDNITHHIKTEESLKTVKSRYSGIVENLPLLIAHFLPEQWEITYVNSKFCKYHNLNKENLVGSSFLTVMPEIGREKIAAHCFGLSVERPIETFEFTVNTNQGKITQCWTFQAIFCKNGKIKEFQALGQDITESKHAADKLAKAIKKAEENERLKSAFLHNISHEIRTPLNGIMGFAELLSAPDITDIQRQNYTKIIVDSGNRLLSIFNDLLSISTLQTKQEKISESNVQLNKLMLDVLTFFTPAAAKKSIDFSFSRRLPDAQAEVYADGSKLQHILKNILANALKFTHCGAIEFGYVLKNDFLEFFIKDTGIGIDEKCHTRIFGEFCQADTSIGRKYGGTGLGLSISKGFIELLGGRIWVQSTPDVGSTFYFTIPFKPIKSVSETEQVQYDVLSKLDGAKILIVEDEELCYFYFKEVFRTFRPTLLHASNGSDAIELCKMHPDIILVLMDMKTPIMDGFKATEEIKKLRPQLPIIAQTAYAGHDDIAKAIAAGCDAYVTKPIKRAALFDKIVPLLK